MTDINIKISNKVTDEEKREARRLYMQQYMAKKYADPEYRQKILDTNRASKVKRWTENPEFRERANAKSRENYHKYKEAYAKVRQEMQATN